MTLNSLSVDKLYSNYNGIKVELCWENDIICTFNKVNIREIALIMGRSKFNNFRIAFWIFLRQKTLKNIYHFYKLKHLAPLISILLKHM